LPLFLLVTSLSYGQKINISTFEHETIQVDVAIKVMASVYQRLGHEMIIFRYPGKRSLMEANKGNVSGELIRIKAVAELLPNLVRLPIEVGHLKAMALTRTGKPKVVGMGGLIGKTVGILRGVEFTDRITKNLSRQVLNSIDSLFQALLKGRVDVILFPELDAKEYITVNQLSEKVMINKAPILKVPLYHYIHKEKPALIQEMTLMLEKLEKSGELDAIIYSAEQARR
jgi:polar amino acid transport system substrate-binding protein